MERRAHGIENIFFLCVQNSVDPEQNVGGYWLWNTYQINTLQLFRRPHLWDRDPHPCPFPSRHPQTTHWQRPGATMKEGVSITAFEIHIGLVSRPTHDFSKPNLLSWGIAKKVKIRWNSPFKLTNYEGLCPASFKPKLKWTGH